MARGRKGISGWSEQDVEEWRAKLRAWMSEQGIGPSELEAKLGYNSDGLLVRMYLGELESSRAPSRPFVTRLAECGFDPDMGENSNHSWKAFRASSEAPEGTIVLGEAKQCPECVAEAKEGKRDWRDTWYIFPWGNQIYCSKEHRRAWYRRQSSSQDHQPR